MSKPTTLTRRLQREIDNGVTYEALAQKLRTSKSQAFDWANGTHQPNLKSLRRIAKCLGCEVVELIGAA